MFLDEKDDGYVKLKFKSKKDNDEKENYRKTNYENGETTPYASYIW